MIAKKLGVAPQPGVSHRLAVQRAGDIAQLRYELTLRIPAERSRPIVGRNVLRFHLEAVARPLIIDFEPDGETEAALVVNGMTVPTAAVAGHLVVPAECLRRGENAVEIEFRAGETPLNRGDDLLYSLFVPARARQALPCFDQPDLKGRWSITLEHPAAWQAVSNAAELQRATADGRTLVRFAATAPLPTYLVAFAVGDLRIETAERGGRTMRMFHRENDDARVAGNRQALFDLHARAIEALERYTGIDYPFDKFDLLLVPAFQFGAMEHPGCIFHRAEQLLLDHSATEQQQLARAHVIAHETAHIWFGDLVTMRWFDDVWTKEVFANFIAARVVATMFPQVGHELQFFLSHHRGAYAVDRSAGANPIRQPLANLDQAGSLYGPIIYLKSPVVMRQLQALLGEQPFRDGVRDYLRRHAFGNATWDDLIAALAPRAGANLRAWSRAWIDQPGRPTIATVLEVDGHGRLRRLVLRQSDPQGRGRRWPQQLRVTVGNAAGQRHIVADLVGDGLDLTAQLGDDKVAYVLPGGEGWGYGDFQLEPASQAYLGANLENLDTALTRGVAWDALWEAMLAGRLRPQVAYDTALRTLAREPEQQLVAAVLEDLQTLWWRWLPASRRQALAPALEQLLRGKTEQAAAPGWQATWFAALRSVAITPASAAWLRALWGREASIAGLPLEERDETAIALALAVRAVDGVEALLDAQLERLANGDRRARLAFIRGAVAADPAVRARWFAALAEPAMRRQEVWVSDGLALLHHPLRAADSATLVRPALDLLLDVHHSGDLFFEARWLAGVLNGHSSPAVAAEVVAVLAALPPGYPPRLRARLLTAADPLFRAAGARRD
ncbi:MAG: M1 family aminopeptidase, partial [Pseudomonadales bacterium]